MVRHICNNHYADTGSMLDTADKKKCCEVTNGFQEKDAAVAEKWICAKH